MHACMYIHTYTHTHKPTYKHTYTHTYIQTYMHTCMHTYIHTYIHSLYIERDIRIHIMLYNSTHSDCCCSSMLYLHVVVAVLCHEITVRNYVMIVATHACV